jgi:hypothetical protein
VYGYIPDKNRGLVFGIMLAIAACTMASQVFNVILLLKMSGTALAIYLVVPMVLYVLSPQHSTQRTSTLTFCFQALRAEAPPER